MAGQFESALRFAEKAQQMHGAPGGEALRLVSSVLRK